MATEITNHVELAWNRLIQQYKQSQSLKDLIEALVNPIQGLETVFQDLSDGRTIEVATGTLLDRLGDIVGIDRVVGQDDDAYRLAIKTKVVENVSQGEPERLISVYKILLSASLVHLCECFPAAVGMMSDVDISTQDEIDNLFAKIKRIAPAGVRIDYLGSFDETEPFAMAGDLIGAGFGSTADALAGGKFATLYIDKSMDFAFDGNSQTTAGFGTLEDPLVGGIFVSL